MNHLFSSFAVFFYISAVGSALITKNLKIWGSLILMGIVSALYAGHLTMMALPILFLIFGITYFYYRAKTNFSKIIAGLAFIVVGAITLLNKVPGVHNWKIIDDVLLTSDAIPLNLYFGFDSGIIGLSVIAFGISTICSKTELKNMLKKLIFLIPLMLIVVISFSIVFGYVKWDPKWTPLVFIWSLSNLFFTCVIEESIFRHFIQKGLQNSFHKIKYGDYSICFIWSSTLCRRNLIHFLSHNC